MASPSRSPSQERGRTRSRTPPSYYSRSRTPADQRRTVSPRSRSRSQRPRSDSRSRSPAIRSTKIVVEKLTKNVREEHLREIFETYGAIRDMDMPLNRQFNTNRGTAYILYAIEAEAEAAIAHMHEAQIDGAIISVSIVLPRRKFSPSPPVARRGANIDPRVDTRGPPRRRSPPAHYSVSNTDTYRPRSMSRSRSPRRRSPSRPYSSRSRSRSPPRRGTRSPARNGRRRRSPSYSSYSSRSRSRDRRYGARR